MEEQRPISRVQWPSAPSSTALDHVVDLIGPVKRVVVTGPLDAVTRAALRGAGVEVWEGTEPSATLADVLLVPAADAAAVAALPEWLDRLASDGLVVLRADNAAHVDRLLLADRDGLPPPEPTWPDARAGIEREGLVLLDVRRVVAPVFHAGVGLDPDSVTPDAVARALADPDAETLTFVACAVRHGARSQVAGLAERLQEAEAALDRERAVAVHRQAALDVDLSIARVRLAEAGRRIEELEQELLEHQQHIEALLSTVTYRVARPLRAAFAKLRSR